MNDNFLVHVAKKKGCIYNRKHIVTQVTKCYKTLPNYRKTSVLFLKKMNFSLKFDK